MAAPTFVRVELDVGGETQISRQFELARAWAEDMSEPLGEMMDLIVEDVRAQFGTEGAQGEHGLWQRLDDEYARWKERHFPGRLILVRDGGMKGAMLNKSSSIRVGPDAAVYEPKSNIAGFHQFGADWMGPAWGHPLDPGSATRRGSRGQPLGPPYKLYPHRLPARRMVDLTDAFTHEAVDRTFGRWIARKLAEGRQAGTPPFSPFFVTHG